MTVENAIKDCSNKNMRKIAVTGGVSAKLFEFSFESGKIQCS